VGTAGGGVCRFDGKEFKPYDESQGLSGPIVNAIEEDKNGNMWFGTSWGGINKFNGKQITKISETDGLISNYIAALIFDSNGNLLIGTPVGLAIYNGKTFTNIDKDEKSNEKISITCFTRGDNGKIWVGTTTGLHLYQNGKITHHIETDKNLNGHITSITVADKNTLYVSSKPGILAKYDITTNTNTIVNLPQSLTITKVLVDKSSNLWIATSNNGLYVQKNGQTSFANYNKQNGLSNISINDIYCDANGIMWFGTRGSGLLRLSTERFEYYDAISGLNDEAIYTVYVDSANNIYTGVAGKGVYMYNGITEKIIIPINEDARVFAINENAKKEIIVGTNDGLVYYKNGKSTFTKVIDSISKPVGVRTILCDSKGNTWLGAYGYGLVKINSSGEKTLFTEKQGLFSQYVYQIKELKNGNLVIGTNNGIFIFDGKNFKLYGMDQGLPNSYIGNIVIDNYQNIWVGTDNGIAVLKGSTFKAYGINEGLSSPTVYLMNKDLDGNIWVGTNKGVDRITVDDGGFIRKIKNYNRFEGFKGIECNARATCIDGKGNLYFGTIKGLIKHIPKYDTENKTEPKVHVTNMRLNFEEINWEKFGDSLSFWFNMPIEHEFSFGQNHLTFDFTGINKSNPEKVRYKYMLEGFEENWNKPTDHDFATYSNLSPGTYIFKVVACNEDDVWSSTPAEIKFTILAPLWRTTGFMIFCAIILAAGIYYYNRIRKLQIKKRNMVLEKLVRERTSELQKQKEERDVLLKEVHHRVKNNLQIVNSLINIQSANITDKEALKVFEESKSKIKSIALIHERLYKSESMSHVDIADYINELVKSLLDTYNINKDIKLVTDIKIKALNLNTVIPLGLLLNEIISNSIKYAFKNTDNGEIYINLRENMDGLYEMKIGDNGSGFSFDPFSADSTTLGLELVKILIEQLDGSVRKLQGEGTYYQLTFKAAKS
jgi:two-component sensor histidine kinase/ligand-binding sensor domain-containing protein